MALAAGLVTAGHGQQGGADQQQLQAIFQRGSQAMHQGNAAEAEEQFRAATRLAPDFAEAWLDLGLAQLKGGKLTEAIPSIRQALKLDPSVRGAHLFLGIAEYQTDQIGDALTDLESAVHEDGNNPETLLWLGIVELDTGHPDQAIGPLDRASELAPNDIGILDYRVQAHMAVARESYTRIYKLDPGSWRLHRLNAQIDAQARQHTQAIDEYQQAISIAPKQADLYEGLGWEYRQTGQLDLAEKAFEEQLKLTPGNPIAMYNLASTQVDAGQGTEALPMLQQVVKLYGRPTVADYYLGRAYADAGKNQLAAAEYEKATTLGGETAQRAWYGLGQAYKGLGRTADARAAVEKFQQLHNAAVQARAKDIEDWRKLNATAVGAPAAPQGVQ
ncbi:MAG TPA: tetratricopeptide repeat protein [Acidobacteriaceae bacterium]|nr:tetratricopeptide repeat protein [Acidobacteriaceae bacterium]